MRRILFVISLLAMSLLTVAQDPVQWAYSTKKVADNLYEIHMTASVNNPWHIYSQYSPDGGAVPTSISFSGNPLVKTDGAVNEIGTLQEKYEEGFGVKVKFYSDKVDFVQIVKLKANVKTNLSGKIEFMACNDHQCLPPKIVSFNVALQ